MKNSLSSMLWAARLYAGRTALWFVPSSTLAAAQAAFAAVAHLVRRYPERYLGER